TSSAPKKASTSTPWPTSSPPTPSAWSSSSSREILAVSSIAHRLNERIFIEVLLFADLRRELLAVVAGRSAEAHSTLALVGVVAPKCHATPDELRRAIHLLEAEICTEADD